MGRVHSLASSFIFRKATRRIQLPKYRDGRQHWEDRNTLSVFVFVSVSVSLVGSYTLRVRFDRISQFTLRTVD